MFQAELRAEDFLMLRIRLRGTTLDELLWGQASMRAERWPGVRIVLRGVMLARGPWGTMELPAGSMIVCRDWHEVQLRSLTPDCDTLRVAWSQGGILGDGDCAEEPFFRLGPRACEAAHRLADVTALPEASDPAWHAQASVLLHTLRAEGVPLRPELPRPLGPDTTLTRTARALERALLPPVGRPGAVDLATALGCGERHALRLVADYLRKLHLSVGTWRDYAVRTRLQVGTLAMSNPLVRTEEAAMALGFASATSFCHAFSLAGLPSPGSLRRKIAQLA